MKIILQYCLLICLTFSLFCCKQKGGELLAEVYDYKLYGEDVPDIYPEGCTDEERSACLQNYINNWINTMLVVQKAEKNLTDSQKDFSIQIDEYKNSLIVHAYEDLLIQQMQEVPISDAEIKEYYESHKDNFLLKNNIVKILYAKIDKNSSYLPKFKQAIFGKINDQAFFDAYGKYTANYFKEDVWLLFDDVLKEIPIETYNQELFLKNNRNITVTDDLYTYLAVVKDFKIKESVSPLSLEKEKIRQVLLNQKKIRLIQNMNADLRKNAEMKGKIVIHQAQFKH